MSEERIRVRYGETDQMGHAYYANYLFWMEQARGRWCRDRGFTYKQLEALGFKLPVVEAHINYSGEVLYDDDIVVRIWMSETKRASMKFEYEISKAGSEKVVTKAYTWHVLMGSERKAMSLTPEFRAMLDRNPEECDQLD